MKIHYRRSDGSPITLPPRLTVGTNYVRLHKAWLALATHTHDMRVAMARSVAQAYAIKPDEQAVISDWLTGLYST